MIKSIAFTAYAVSDLARAKKFYEEVLGLSPAMSIGGHWQEYDLGEGTFGIGVVPDSAPDYYKGRGQSVAFEVEDIDATLARMKAHNVPMLTDMNVYPGCRSIVIADPDGNVIHLHQLNKK